MTQKSDTQFQINRRQFMALAASSITSLAAVSTLTACSATRINKDQLIIGGYSRTDNAGNRLKEYGVLAVQAQNSALHTKDNYQVISDFSVPDEVHLATLFPDQKSILVNSRKPGASLLKYSLKGELLAELKPLENQHFEGHAIFSSDEQYLYATASDYQQGKGKLLKLNSHDLSLVEGYDSAGIGPHELVWQSNNLIAIANTGVLTHPDSGRDILNINNIQSNVVLFNTINTRIEHEWRVPQRGLSARHLDRMDSGDLVIGCQYKKQDKRPSCIAFARKGRELLFADTHNEKLHWDMQGYTASIKSIPKTDRAIIANPRGHILTQWQNKNQLNSDVKSANQLVKKESIEFNKGLKITRNGKYAWISKGSGELLLLNATTNKLNNNKIKIKENIWWANHLG
jgi:hypothetical protein